MLCINTCDVDTVAVMSNTVNNRICQRTGVSTKLVIPFFKTILRTKDRGGFLTSSMQKLKNVFLFDSCWFQQKSFIKNENQRIGVFSHDLSIGTIRPCHFQINNGHTWYCNTACRLPCQRHRPCMFFHSLWHRL